MMILDSPSISENENKAGHSSQIGGASEQPSGQSLLALSQKKLDNIWERTKPPGIQKQQLSCSNYPEIVLLLENAFPTQSEGFLENHLAYAPTDFL